ncbi:MAG: hypothetical protein JWS10_927 [Cypionkella sp.]|uniref:hypothetical protein n=1 Tax=Cypionkella sp. TaxID=2811411 RepID=UPI002625E963|nr:hypothetical protein [Cypionkella sp.]MDB5658312.1 hypothetical protein [Cypionkella sp.]
MKIVKNRPFKATVKVVYPGDDATADSSFIGHFLTLNREALQGIVLGTTEAEDEYMAKMFTGWEGLVDSDDAPFDINPENREALLGDMAVRRAVMATYREEMAGLRRGN